MYRLALESGRVDIDRLAGELTLRDVILWKAYYLNEPFGTHWQRTARLAAWLSAAFGAKMDEDSEDKFLPNYRAKPQTDEEIEAELNKIPWFRKSHDGSDR